jgi:hypothetical protein
LLLLSLRHHLQLRPGPMCGLPPSRPLLLPLPLRRRPLLLLLLALRSLLQHRPPLVLP